MSERLRTGLSRRDAILAAGCAGMLGPLAGCAALRPDGDVVLEALIGRGVERGFPGIAFWSENPAAGQRFAAAGRADITRGVPMRADTPFHLCSITKSITAVAALKLVDSGQLSLDAVLSSAAPLESVRRIPHADVITVRQLIDHSSGIYATNNDPAYLDTVIGANADPLRVWSAEELIALADADHAQPLGEPGVGHHYSDTNYILLSVIIARASGRPFKDFVRRELFDPLGMQSTYFYSDRLPVDGLNSVSTTHGYLLATPDLRGAIDINAQFRPVAGASVNGVDLLDTTLASERIDGAGGVVSTLPDLAKFARALFQGRLLSPQSQRVMMAAGEEIAAEPLGRRRIRALRAVRKPFGTLVFAEGDGPGGANTLMAFHPESGRIFLGFVNVFGFFDEVEWMMDSIIGQLLLER